MVLRKIGETETEIQVNGSTEGTWTQSENSTYNISISGWDNKTLEGNVNSPQHPYYLYRVEVGASCSHGGTTHNMDYDVLDSDNNVVDSKSWVTLSGSAVSEITNEDGATGPFSYNVTDTDCGYVSDTGYITVRCFSFDYGHNSSVSQS